MQIALLAARLLLSGLFGVAGVAKFANRTGSRQTLIEFGAPKPLAFLLGMLLPLAELLVAAALLPASSAWLGALGAISLLLLFIFGIAFNLARGRRPDCHCFGQLSSAPAGWSTLVRNVVLLVVAGFVAWYGWDNAGFSAVNWFGDLTIAQRVLLIFGLVGLILLGAQGWVLLQVVHQQGRLLLQLDSLNARLTSIGLAPTSATAEGPTTEGLPIGSAAPNFHLDGLRGETLTLDSLIATGKPVMLFFTNPQCGPCQSLMPDISLWQHDHISQFTLALISEGPVEENRIKSYEYNVNLVLLQQEREVAEAYLAFGTPSAVLVRPDGTIGSHLAMGADGVRELVTQILRPVPLAPLIAPYRNGQNGNGGSAKTQIAVVTMGQRAPKLTLQDLTGKTIDLSALRGTKTLLLFWNPNCGFCQQMLDVLNRVERVGK